MKVERSIAQLLKLSQQSRATLSCAAGCEQYAKEYVEVQL